MAVLAPRRSLRARAFQLLAQREQSRTELRRKLLAHALAEERAGHDAHATASTSFDPGAVPGDEFLDADKRADPAARAGLRVEAELDWLEAHKHLSPERFVESRVHARSARFGNVRIRQELALHQLDLPVETEQTLKDSEFERACAVLARKFSQAPQDASARARRARFLAGRGFSSEVIRRAVQASVRPTGDDPAGRTSCDDEGNEVA